MHLALLSAACYAPTSSPHQEPKIYLLFIYYCIFRKKNPFSSVFYIKPKGLDADIIKSQAFPIY